jgi:hypothetical protein
MERYAEGSFKWKDLWIWCEINIFEAPRKNSVYTIFEGPLTRWIPTQSLQGLRVNCSHIDHLKDSPADPIPAGSRWGARGWSATPTISAVWSKPLLTKAVFGVFGVMFGLFVRSGIARHRQNGAWNKPMLIRQCSSLCTCWFLSQYSITAFGSVPCRPVGLRN